jgi:3-methyl-2-oxobutanoate hydroxymethyltransferase
MPFLSYQTSVSDAILNAGRFLKEGGAQGVKIEGGLEMKDTVKRLIEVGIPVMGHIGMTPQSIEKFGGYSVQGKDEKKAEYLLESAKVLEDVGCFSIVLECIPRELAKKITSSLKIPTIGIGAGIDCDGQVLVVNDILGLYEEFKPKFVRRYAEVAKEMRKACKNFIDDVKTKKYPSEEESY